MVKETRVLPVFLKYLRLASDRMEEGLKLYRAAALRSPTSKREQALREVIVAEQVHFWGIQFMLPLCLVAYAAALIFPPGRKPAQSP